jgi:hypothetical protein
MIRFSLARAGAVDLTVSDVTGRRVRSLLARDAAVRTAGEVQTRKLIREP